MRPPGLLVSNDFPLAAWLADPVHMAWLGDDVVVLDVAADRYTCIVDGSALLRPGERPGALRIATPALEDISEAGWISAGPGAPRKPPVSPRTSLATPVSAQVYPAVMAGLAAWSDGRRLQRLSLERMIGPSETPWPSDGAVETLPARVATFMAALPWVPDQGQCLQRAYTLRRQLARRGLQVDWVFGVRTWPFMAHCWLQLGNVVIADDVDRVRGFTPIMVV